MALLYIFQRSLVRQTCLLLVKLQWEVLPVQLQLAALDPTSKAQGSWLQVGKAQTLRAWPGLFCGCHGSVPLDGPALAVRSMTCSALGRLRSRKVEVSHAHIS